MKQDVKISEKDIITYIMKMREENYSYSSMKVMLSSLFLFFDMNGGGGGQIKVLKTQIEKLNNETKSNIEEFIDIAKQIQEINSRTKIDPNTRKKMKTGEIGRDEIFELYIQDREQKRKRKQELEQHLQKYTIQEQQQQQERC